MTSEVPKKPPTRRKGDSHAKALKDAHIRAQALAGKGVGQIAKELGMDRKQVSKTLNSEETKAKIKEVQGRLAAMIDDAIETIHDAIVARHDMGNALKAATQVLKNFGALKESVDLNHNFPKPTVIHKRDGSTVVLGTTADLKEDEKE